MSDNAVRLPHHQALRVAEQVLHLLGGTYERAAVVGSIRRGKREVGDVELALRPTFIDGVNLLEFRCSDLLRTQTLTLRRKRDGSVLSNAQRYKAVVFESLPIDLFIVLPDRHWGVTALLRTGPYDANMTLVTPTGALNREGQRGILPKGLRFADGGLWDGDALLTTPEEVHVFKACGLPWIPPHERTVERYQNMATGQKYRHVVALAKWDETTDAVYSPDGRVVEVRMPAPVVSGGRAEQLEMF